MLIPDRTSRSRIDLSKIYPEQILCYVQVLEGLHCPIRGPLVVKKITDACLRLCVVLYLNLLLRRKIEASHNRQRCTILFSFLKTLSCQYPKTCGQHVAFAQN